VQFLVPVFPQLVIEGRIAQSAALSIAPKDTVLLDIGNKSPAESAK
jgi:hypothetical protein